MTTQRPSWLTGGVVASVVLLALAGCGSSSHKTGSSPTNASPTAAPTTAAQGGSPTSAANTATAAYTISTANVPGVGKVLVNGEGRTLYLLSSEKGSKITCTDDNGCTKIWPDTELPSGVSHPVAGSGIQSSLLSTVKDPSGKLYVTYATYPLYEFFGDQGAGTAKGEGITSFGGTWYAIEASGQPAMGSASSSTTTPTTSRSGY